MMHKRFQMSFMGELTFFLGLQIQQKEDGIFISQDKYVADILKKFDFVTVKTASTPIKPNKALVKDEEADNVDFHLYRSMIRSLMYLTASRPDITFAVCACARFQVTPKISHLHAMKRIFRYLKGQPKLGLWYLKDSPFDLEAFSDSDYVGASLDRKSTTGGCQFLGKRHVLWIQNQMIDYRFNFMNTKIYIDNESTICIVKNPVFHSKTKHIEIRHYFIRDSHEKKLIQNAQPIVALIEGRMITMDWRCFLDEIKVNIGISKISTDRQSSMVGFSEMRQLEVLRLILEEISYNWYALTKNPTIYVSLIEKLWHTATVRTVDNEEQEINATVDGKEFTITKASVRRHLQLADVDAEEGEGSGNPSEPQPPPSTAQPTHEEPIPNIESSSPQKTQSPRQALNKDTELPQTSVPIPNVSDEAVHQERLQCAKRPWGASAQTRFKRESKLSYDSPLGGGNIPESDEDSMTLQELTALCTKLSDRVLALETDLRQTKKVYGTAYTKLIMKVKKLEKTIKTSQARRRAKIVVSDDDMASEDSSKQRRMIEEID
ncbi:putative ribonuclease H-like domain-containing protein [Tanacetum coccineum]